MKEPGTGRSWRRLRTQLPVGPVRVLATVTLVNRLGSGLLTTVLVLYFTQVVGLSAVRVGTGLTIAAAVGVAAGVPAGRAADRFDPRGLFAALLAGEALAVTGYLFVKGFAWFVVAASVMTALDRAAWAVGNALTVTAFTGRERVQARALLRVVTNLGAAGGAAVAGAALQIGTRSAYQALIVADAVSFLAAAAMLGRLPRPSRTPQARDRQGARWLALRDGPYLVITGLAAVLALQYGLLQVAIPLWVVRHTTAPRIMVAALYMLNALAVALLQMCISRGTDDLTRAARICRRAGPALALACGLFAAAAGHRPAVAVVLLLAAAAAQAAGELLSSAGGWGLAFGLADDRAPGQYQGLYAAGYSLSLTVAPLLAILVVAHGTMGWALIGAAFLSAATAITPAASWATRHRAAGLGPRPHRKPLEQE